MTHNLVRAAHVGALVLLTASLAYCLPLPNTGPYGPYSRWETYQNFSTGVAPIITFDTPTSDSNPSVMFIARNLQFHQERWTAPNLSNPKDLISRIDEPRNYSFKFTLQPSTRYTLYRVGQYHNNNSTWWEYNTWYTIAPAAQTLVAGAPGTGVLLYDRWIWNMNVSTFESQMGGQLILCGPCGEIPEGDGPQIVFSPAPPTQVATDTTQVILTGEARDATGVKKVEFDHIAATLGDKRLVGDLWYVPFSVTLPLPPVPSDRTGVRYQLKAEATDESGYSSSYPLCIDVGVYDPANEGGEGSPCQENTSPVNAKSGGYFTAATDLTLGPSNELSLNRRYHAQSGYNGPLGRGWVHDFDWQLYEITDLVDDWVLLRCAKHNRIKFKKLPDGSIESPAEWSLSLARGPADVGYVLSTKDGLRFSFDANGLLVSISDANNNVTALQRDATNKLVQVYDGGGRSFSFAYSVDGKMTQLADHAGRSVGYSYAGSGLLDHVTDPCGFNTYYQYQGAPARISAILDNERRPLEETTFDDLGRVATVVEAGLLKTYTRRPRERKTVVTDALSRTTIVEYNERGQVLRRTRPDGAVIRWEREPVTGLITRYVDALGRETRYSFSGAGDLIETVFPNGTSAHSEWTVIAGKHLPLKHTDAAGSVTTFSYDTSGNTTGVLDSLGQEVLTYNRQGQLLSQTDRRGFVTRYEYEPGTGNVVRAIDPLNNAITRTYDPQGNVVAVTDKRGNTTSYVVDPLRRVTQLMGPPESDGRRAITQFVYNQCGRVTQVRGPLGDTATDSYDQFGRPLTHVSPRGTSTTRTYDAAGRLTVTSNARGGTTRYQYDCLDRTTSVTDASGATRLTTYDATGTSLSITDADGHATQYLYDALGQLTQVVAPDGACTRYEYDAFGRCTTVIDPLERRTEYEHDTAGRLLLLRRFLEGQPVESRYQYDSAGNTLLEVDPLGRTRQQEYDALNRLTCTRDAAGAQTLLAYDPNGNLTSLTDANGHACAFSYDSLNRQVVRRDPLGNETCFEYDQASELVARTDAMGRAKALTYDADGNLTHVQYADGEWVDRTLDELGNLLSVRGAAAGGPTVELTQEFDSVGRVTAISNLYLQRRIEYSYTPSGRRSSMIVRNLATSSTEQEVHYEWDSASRLVRITPWFGGPVEYTYNLDGTRRNVLLPNNIRAEYDWDGLGRLGAIAYRDGAGRTATFARYVRDKVGNPLLRDDPEGQSQFSYDQSDRLLEARYPDGTWEHFQYDAVGNRLCADNQLGRVTCSYDDADRMVSEGGARSASYSWSANGNLLSRSDDVGVTHFAWSARDKLMRVELPDGSVVAHTYLPSSDYRLSVTDSHGTERRALWDGENVIAELDGGNAVVASFLEGPQADEHLAMVAREGILTPLADATGSIVGVADAASSVVDTYSYGAFGRARRCSETVAAYPYRFAGRPSGAAGYYVRGRYYLADAATWMSPDIPCDGTGTQVAPYSFARSNPVRFSDPSGWSVQFVGEETRGVAATLAKRSADEMYGNLEKWPRWNRAVGLNGELEATLTFGVVPNKVYLQSSTSQASQRPAEVPLGTLDQPGPYGAMVTEQGYAWQGGYSGGNMSTEVVRTSLVPTWPPVRQECVAQVSGFVRVSTATRDAARRNRGHPKFRLPAGYTLKGEATEDQASMVDLRDLNLGDYVELMFVHELAHVLLLLPGEPDARAVEGQYFFWLARHGRAVREQW